MRPHTPVPTKATRCPLFVVATALLVLAIGGSPAGAAPDAASPAASLLDRYVEAAGGKAAHDRLTTRVTRMSMELVGKGLTLDITSYSARPNRALIVTESPVIGKIEKGTDGDTAWEISTMTGPRIIEGQERADFLREVTFDRLVRWRELYAKTEAAGVEEVEGRASEKVILEPNGAKPQTWWLDRETGLPAKIAITAETPMGSTSVESYPGDYRRVDGVLVAFKTRTRVLNQDRVVTVKEVVHNVELPAERFAVPAEVRALIEKKKAASAEPPAKP